MTIGLVGVIVINVCQQFYPAFELIYNITLTASCFPGLANLGAKEKGKQIYDIFNVGAVFVSISIGVNMRHIDKQLFP
jgi:hypothetical protein